MVRLTALLTQPLQDLQCLFLPMKSVQAICSFKIKRLFIRRMVKKRERGGIIVGLKVQEQEGLESSLA